VGEQEYQRRLQHESTETGGVGGVALGKRIAAVRRPISRLIDGHSEGLLEKSGLEPRLQTARQRLARLEAEAQIQTDVSAQQAELRLVIGKLQEFGEESKQGLEQADEATRRQVIRALVKHIEMGDDNVRIVYRVPPVPFVEPPSGAFNKIVRGVATRLLMHAAAGRVRSPSPLVGGKERSRRVSPPAGMRDRGPDARAPGLGEAL
jgi:site-specific DNA recombinase